MGGTLIVIAIAIVGVILVLILVMKAIRRKPQYQDTNKKGITMDHFVHVRILYRI